jgi:hypothetical protein
MSEVETTAPEPAPAPSADNAINSDTPTVGSPAEREGAKADDLTLPEGPIDLDRPKDVQLREAREREIDRLKGEASEPKSIRPPDMPRSWSNEDIPDWLALKPEQRARVAERERKREADHHREFQRSRNEVAERGKEFQAAWEQHVAETQAALAAGKSWERLVELRNSIMGAGITTAEQFQALQASDPAAAEKYASELAELQALAPQVENALLRHQEQQRAAHERQQAEAQQQFQNYVASEDEKFQSLVPEAADPEKFGQLQEAALDALVELGFDENALAQEWHTNPLLRDHRTQLLLAQMGRQRLAQMKAAEAKPKMPPKPQMPGVYRERANVSSLEAAAKNGDMASFVRMRERGQSR